MIKNSSKLLQSNLNLKDNNSDVTKTKFETPIFEYNHNHKFAETKNNGIKTGNEGKEDTGGKKQIESDKDIVYVMCGSSGYVDDVDNDTTSKILIKNIKIEEKILTTDDTFNKKATTKINKIINTFGLTTFFYTYDNRNKIFKTSSDFHLFYENKSQQWIKAKDLKFGDEILNLQGVYSKIENINTKSNTLSNFKLLVLDNKMNCCYVNDFLVKYSYHF